MTTIYLPRTDYVQRADDEGRDYHAARTVRAALDAWRTEAPLVRDWHSTNRDEPDEHPIAFAVADPGRSVVVSSVSPDEDMEGLYPAADLPFTIATYLAEPGDWVAVNVAGATPRRVIDIQPDGSVDIDIHGDRGRIRPGDTGWHIVPAPTHTFTVTVTADHDGGAVLDALSAALSGRVTVDPA